LIQIKFLQVVFLQISVGDIQSQIFLFLRAFSGLWRVRSAESRRAGRRDRSGQAPPDCGADIERRARAGAEAFYQRAKMLTLSTRWEVL
jgi:hypothetical protein